MEEQRMKVLKDYQMMGGIIPEGTVLKLIGKCEPSGEVYVDEEGNKFNFDVSEILFSGCFSFKNEGDIDV